MVRASAAVPLCALLLSGHIRDVHAQECADLHGAKILSALTKVLEHEMKVDENSVRTTKVSRLFFGGDWRKHCSELVHVVESDLFHKMLLTFLSSKYPDLPDELSEEEMEYVANSGWLDSSSVNVEVGGIAATQSWVAAVRTNPHVKNQFKNFLVKSVNSEGFRTAVDVICRATAVAPPEMRLCYSANLLAKMAGSTTFGIKFAKGAGAVLTAGMLAYDVVRNLQQYWRGEITGATATLEIAGSLSGAGGGLLGCAAGTALFSFVGVPWVGCFAGSLAGGWTASAATKAVLSDLLDVPKDAALAKAYAYFNVGKYASNDELNRQYRKMVRVSHPDKPGGSKEKFLELGVHWDVVRISRGQFSAAERVRSFYAKHRPEWSNEENVDRVLEAHDGDYQKMYHKLADKYGTACPCLPQCERKCQLA